MMIYGFVLSVTEAQNPTKETIYFVSGMYNLSEESTRQLDFLVKRISDNQTKQITISGFTDEDGTDDYNLLLSKQRAEEVYNYFINKGFPKAKIEIKYFGKKYSVAANDNEFGKQQNRRVEISYKVNSGGFAKASQTFKVISTNNITLTCKEGTKITFPKNAFKTSDGKVFKGVADVEIAEFYKKSDVILNNLSTTSDKQLLESGGMLFIDAKCGIKQLLFDPSLTYKIQLPNVKQRNWSLFYGDTTDNQLDWVPAPTALQGDRFTYTNNIFVKQVKDIRLLSYLDSSKATSYSITVNNMTVQSKSDSIGNVYLTSNKIGWLNCDYFYKSRQKTGIYVSVPDPTDVTIYLIFKNINSVVKSSPYSDNFFPFYNIPVGEIATIIAFSIKGDKIFYASKDIKTSVKKQEQLVLKEINQNDFDNMIADIK